MIQVKIDKTKDSVSGVWDGVDLQANTKYVRVKVQNDICIHYIKLVMCLSTNGERA